MPACFYYELITYNYVKLSTSYKRRSITFEGDIYFLRFEHEQIIFNEKARIGKSNLDILKRIFY